MIHVCIRVWSVFVIGIRKSLQTPCMVLPGSYFPFCSVKVDCPVSCKDTFVVRTLISFCIRAFSVDVDEKHRIKWTMFQLNTVVHCSGSHLERLRLILFRTWPTFLPLPTIYEKKQPNETQRTIVNFQFCSNNFIINVKRKFISRLIWVDISNR